MYSTLLTGQHLHQLPQTSPNKSTAANEKKTVVFVEPQTPGKTSGKSAPLENLKIMGPLTTPTKGPDAPTGEPWTPTSNLKMLISAASPEIRNREKERSADNMKPEETECSSQEPELGEESEKLHLSRKEKSLGLLCHKFLARYPDYPNPAINNDICLDDVATELNVERRRIYDIMNVLESLHMVSRLAKNRYTWHGRAKLAQTLAALRRAGEENRYGQQMLQLKQKNLDQEFELDGEEKENEEEADGQKELSFISETAGDAKTAGSRKDKSLRVMSQKFVMLFLVSSPRVVSLEIAAKILIGEDQVVDQDKSKFKTKIRRLYDIANVLSSLELIKKVHVTEDRGRKPAFKWTGPEDLPSAQDVEVATVTASSLSSRPLESRSSLDNCTKNLFCSPGTKRGFTRHHSLVKLAKSIQDDRRKINSAPTSPVKMTSEAVSGGLAHLAAICKMQLDKQTVNIPQTPNPDDAVDVCEDTLLTSAGASTAAAGETGPACPPGVHFPVLPAGAVSYLPSPCSSVIPVLLPQPQVGRSYALYVHHAPARPHPSLRPPPTSLVVRSMTFESPGGPSHKVSPAAAPAGQAAQGHDCASPSLKRVCAEPALEGSPSKIKCAESSSPKLGEILQARLKARRGALKSSRPSSRALHLDPEFTKPPEPRSAPLDQSLENFLEKEEKLQPESRETTLTPTPTIHTQKMTPNGQEMQSGLTHSETLLPTGYLIPIPQPPLLSSSEAPKTSTPTYNIYHTPTAGSRPPPPQEFTPTGLHLPRVPPLSPFSSTPSPSILNFTLQNLGLIPSPSTPTPTHAPCGVSLEHPGPAVPPGMIFVKPVSPAGTLQHGALHGQPVTFISLQQPLLTTPKGRPALQHTFFHTPVSSLPTITTPTAPKTLYIPQRKLEVSSEDS